MKRIKFDNRPLCYIGLVFLIVLLLLPPGLRIFGKDLYVEEEVKKDEVIILSCNKKNETISSTFFNSEPQNIDYRIKGDYSVSIVEENSTTTEEEKVKKDTNDLIERIRSYAKIEYDKKENKTIFKVKISDLKEAKDYNTIFNTLENQRSYYELQAFYCDKLVY